MFTNRVQKALRNTAIVAIKTVLSVGVVVGLLALAVHSWKIALPIFIILVIAFIFKVEYDNADFF